MENLEEKRREVNVRLLLFFFNFFLCSFLFRINFPRTSNLVRNINTFYFSPYFWEKRVDSKRLAFLRLYHFFENYESLFSFILIVEKKKVGEMGRKRITLFHFPYSPFPSFSKMKWKGKKNRKERSEEKKEE